MKFNHTLLAARFWVCWLTLFPLKAKQKTNQKNKNVGGDLRIFFNLKQFFHISFLLLQTLTKLEFPDAKEDTVSKEREHDEVNRGEHAAANTSLRLDPVVHDSIPVLASQNLRKTKEAARHCANPAECRIKLLYWLKGYEHRLIEGLSVSPLGDRRYTDQSFPLIKNDW